MRDELEAQRRLLEQRLGELEARRVEVDQLHQEALEASRAVAAAIAIKPRVLSPIDRVVAVAAGPERKDNEPARPKDWRGYARWLMPSISVALLMLAIALGIGLAHRSRRAPSVVTVGGSKIIATPPAGLEAGRDPRGGFLSQSAGGRVMPPMSGQPAGPPVTSPAAASATLPTTAVPPADSADSAFTRDSLAAVKARVDSVAAARRRQNARRLAQLRLDSIMRDSMSRRDSITRPRQILRFRRDTIART